MDMRVRLTELMEAKGLSAYEIANRSDRRITMSTIYRLKKADGRMEYLNTSVLEALCDVLDVGPGELLERDKKSRR